MRVMCFISKINFHAVTALIDLIMGDNIYDFTLIIKDIIQISWCSFNLTKVWKQQTVKKKS